MKKPVQRTADHDEIEFIEKEPDFSPAMFEHPVEKEGDVPEMTIYLYKEIGPPEHYIEMCHLLQYAAPEQDITIRINSPGGNLHTCMSIVNSIMTTEANVYTVLDGDASSAAAFIWLAGHNKSIATPHTNLMIHGASCGFGYSKLADITNSTNSANVIVESLLDELTEWVLTANEREDIRKGVDVNLHGTEIIRRIESSKLNTGGS